MNYLDSLYWIHERSKFGIKPGVKRMEWMLEQFNNPQDKIIFMLVARMVRVYGSLSENCFSGKWL